MKPLYFDTETCGLHGVPVLIQYAIGDGPVVLHEIWREPIIKTLELVEMFCKHEGGVVAFNIAFDWFHICKIYTILHAYKDYTEFPDEIIPELAALEKQAIFGPCVKPSKVCDLFLVAKKTHYQSLMDRKDIRIKRVPTALAFELAKELDKRIPIKDIYFARKQDKKKRWDVRDVKNSEGELNPDFKDLVLNFAPSSGLKALAMDALGVQEVIEFGEIEVPKAFWPVEKGYAPFGGWPEVIKHHIEHWQFNARAREYAAADVDYTRRLYAHFGNPEMNDDDSVLACCVAANRWRGYAVDLPKLKELAFQAAKEIQNIPTAPNAVQNYVLSHLTPTEKAVIRNKFRVDDYSTKKPVLEEIANLQAVCIGCSGNSCDKCKGTGLVVHPAAERARKVIHAREMLKEIELYEKIIEAGRFHPSLKVIGALSGRMSGADGLNPQGIKKAKYVRECFILKDGDDTLDSGDFDAFEVTLADAAYNDPGLRKDLLTCEKCEGECSNITFTCNSCGSAKRKKIHALFGMSVYPHMTYEEIKATDGTTNDIYTDCKRAVFALFYGGTAETLADRLGVDIEIAKAAEARFVKKYPNVGLARKRIMNDCESMKQPNGIGTRVIWNDPIEYISSLLGFRRYFTLENSITKALFDLSAKPPDAWKHIKIKVVRRDREQTAFGAVQSALYAAAFAIQAANTRAALNHEIQSTGAQITKAVQRAIWDLQPAGVHEFIVRPLNIHDEIPTVVKRGFSDKVKEVVHNTVESFRLKVPLIRMEWKCDKKNWAEK